MSDRQRWVVSFGSALLFYAIVFACLSGVAKNRFSVPTATAVEIRLPSLFSDGVRQERRMPRTEEPKSAVTDDRLPTFSSARTQTQTQTTAAEQAADAFAASVSDSNTETEESGRPQIDFVTATVGVELPMPGYPAAARRKGIEGAVTVRLTVDADGNVSAAEILGSSHEWFRREVAAVVKTWRFPPRPNGFITEKQFVFQLRGEK